MNLQGQLAGVAPVNFRGTLGALGTEDTSDLLLTMENLALPVRQRGASGEIVGAEVAGSDLGDERLVDVDELLEVEGVGLADARDQQ